MTKSWPPVSEFKTFYATRLGRITHRVMQRALVQRFRESEKNILGIGYCLPYLASCKTRGNHIFSVIPVASGKIRWPKDSPNCTCTAYESLLPFADHSMDLVMVIHAFEHSAQSHIMMKEIARVLKPQGKLLLILPNALGIWARMPTSPFASGKAFLPFMLPTLLEGLPFTLTSSRSLLYFPPSPWRFLLRTYRIWEMIGSILPGLFGGISLLEATKEEYALITEPNFINAKGRISMRTSAALGNTYLATKKIAFSLKKLVKCE